MQQKTNNREQMPQEQFQRVQKKIEIPQLQFTKEAMRTKIAHTTLEKTFDERHTLNQAVVRIVNGTARAWSIQHEVRGDHLSRLDQPGNGDAGGSRTPQT